MSEEVVFSDRLAAWRKIKGLSQGAAAEVLGINRTYFSQLETGKKEPGKGLVARFDVMSRVPDPQPDYEMSTEATGSAEEPVALINGPRAALRQALKARGWSVKDLSSAIGYDYGVLDNLVHAGGRISDRMAEKIVGALPDLSLDQLLDGSETSLRVSEGDVTTGIYGEKPDIEVVDGVQARYIPLLSMAQAGTMGSWEDTAYETMGSLAIGVTDRRAFALEIRGDSMMDRFQPGDRAVVYPSSLPKNGRLVVARLKDDLGGDVMFKIYHNDGRGGITLTSYNPAYPPIHQNIRDFVWIFPVNSVLTYT